MACRLASIILRLVAKEKVAGHQLGIAERSQVGAVGPKHHSNHSSGEFTAWLPRRILRSAMSLQESGRWVKCAMYLDVSALVSRLPVKFEWFVMKTSII